nr:MAG TPA: hypothetical protein [Caudoviricetes sp.]
MSDAKGVAIPRQPQNDMPKRTLNQQIQRLNKRRKLPRMSTSTRQLI